ncbi:MAG: type I 3-dehydroquinate dehydratase [Dissulfurimicrobium sp.]|uniref:type I 3-dehydroquinate dehydratase n=1 Tax=Dissulfurimicrobium TaxID=1769732 RepID=UPI001EDA55A0|nr:type I 3-dehydroquinate dehydratase [Dissulfurimicrobium hydrothermale]UKL13830.1 type I 3-dehydroquinate dehydratase [Dissulfurimicrobium hydrothermale]
MYGLGVKDPDRKIGPKICVSLSGSSVEAMLQALKDSTPYADLAEIRLDAVSDTKRLDIGVLIKNSPLPLIFTNRPFWEGGGFSGDEADRLRPLLEAARSGAEFIDIELRAEPRIRSSILKEARRCGCKVIASFHDFSGTPDDSLLLRAIEESCDIGADIAKIAVMARSEDDVRRVLSLYFRRPSGRTGSIPLIAFAMGPLGRASRLACVFLGSYLTFASPAGGAETAPGQIPLREMRAMVDYLSGRQPELTF